MREAKRVFRIHILVFAAVLIVVNAFLVLSSSRADADVVQAYDELILRAKDQSEAASIQEAAVLAWQQYFTEHGLSLGLLVNGTEEERIAGAARDMLLETAAYVDGFWDSVRERMDTALRVAGSGIYGTDSFEYINLLKTRYDLSQIAELKISLGNGIWLDRLYGSNNIQIFVLMLLFATVYSFFAERKTGLYYIIHAARSGRSKLFLTRCGILVLEAFVASCLFYVESTILFLHAYGGLEGIHDPAAGNEVLLLTAGSLSRLEFVGVMILASTMTATVLAMLLWLVLSFFRNVNIGMAVYLMLCGIDVLLHMLVPVKAALRAVRFVNLYYLLFPNQALNYYNWGYSFGVASLLESTAVLALVLGAGVFLANLGVSVKAYFSSRENVMEMALNRLLEVFGRLVEKLPALCKEMYKILFSQKTGVILLLLLLVSLRIKTGPGMFYDTATAYLAGYYQEAEGLRYGPELEAIYEKYLADYEQVVESVDPSQPGAEQILQNRAVLLQSIRGNMDYVKRMNEQGIDAVVLNPYEYTEALGRSEGYNQKLLALLNVLAAIVVSCGYISYEKKSEVHRLALACCRRRRWLIRKILAAVFLIAVFEGLTYGVYYYRLSSAYEFVGMTSPLKSLPMFQAYPFNPPIIGFLLTDMVVRLVLLSALSVVMCFTSMHVKYLYCLVLGLVPVVPQLLCMMGFEALDVVSIGRYVAYLPCFLDGGASARAYYVFAACVTILGGVLYFRIIRKETVSR